MCQRLFVKEKKHWLKKTDLQGLKDCNVFKISSRGSRFSVSKVSVDYWGKEKALVEEDWSTGSKRLKKRLIYKVEDRLVYSVFKTIQLCFKSWIFRCEDHYDWADTRGAKKSNFKTQECCSDMQTSASSCEIKLQNYSSLFTVLKNIQVTRMVLQTVCDQDKDMRVGRGNETDFLPCPGPSQTLDSLGVVPLTMGFSFFLWIYVNKMTARTNLWLCLKWNTSALLTVQYILNKALFFFFSIFFFFS